MRVRRNNGRPLILLAILLSALLAGCVDPSSPVEVVPFYVLNDAQPGRTTEFAFHLTSTSPFRQDLPLSFEAPRGWQMGSELADISIRGRDTASLVVQVTPDPNASYEPHEVSLFVGDTRARVLVNVRDLGTEPARAGVGVQLYYGLWYDNGTLASTNDPALRGRTALGPAALDENVTTDEPLRVYVGGRRGEDPPEPYNSTGYRPVIPGFDARLRNAGTGRGMVAGETLAVHVPKEQAYTTPGNEAHPLYGLDLNFLIRVVTVDVLEVRACGLPACPPELPPTPGERVVRAR